ncbi:MAG: DUF4105 domain-containing protein [SAR324 cluster bacterium]|nr:DUF4105 domain-containing protein [SAR324 cluster bacterium]
MFWLLHLFLLLLFFSVGNHALAQAQNSKQIPADKVSRVSELWKQASQRQLYKHPYWLKLLHFYSIGESVGQWSFKSDIASTSFFLAETGKTDPKAELKATLSALLSPKIQQSNQHARCKFIARFNWLRSELDFPELEELKCPLFERWADLKEAKELSIVFVSAFLRNPASTFGHLLIKFNSSNPHFGHSLLRPTLNFGAITNADDNPLVYALRGLFGGYDGRFSDERFYNFNHVYGENELRDLWEYPLHFTREQQKRITYHAWELLQGVNFTYYFFLDNCAYRMAELLEMAWTDSTRINTSGALWAIPIDVIFKLKKFKSSSENHSLLGYPKLIPSRQRKLQRRVAQLDNNEQEQLKQLIDAENSFDSAEFLSFSRHSQARILDALLDYHQYAINESSKEQYRLDRTKLLQVRSNLPILEKIDSTETVISPVEGSPPMRFRFGTVYNDKLGPAFELGTWANYHDLLGEESGHFSNAEVVTLDLRIQMRKNTFAITKFQLFNIQKLALNPTGISDDNEWSWRARGGWEREKFTCFPCRQFRVAGGFGRAVSLGKKDLEYIFVDLFAETKKDTISAVAYGLAPHFGMTWSPISKWKVRFEGGWFTRVSGPKKQYLRTLFDQRLTLGQNWDIRLELRQNENIEATFALHYFW